MTDEDEVFSLFGDMDVSNISDDPWEVAPNTYWCTCTESLIKTSTKDGVEKTQLLIKWMVDEPESDYHGSSITEWYNLFPGRNWDDLDANEKKALKFLKRRLRRGFDLSEEEIARLRPSQLIGGEAFVTVVVRDGTGANAGKSFTNVNDAVCKRLWEEENEGKAASDSSTFGI